MLEAKSTADRSARSISARGLPAASIARASDSYIQGSPWPHAIAAEISSAARAKSPRAPSPAADTRNCASRSRPFESVESTWSVGGRYAASAARRSLAVKTSSGSDSLGAESELRDGAG